MTQPRPKQGHLYVISAPSGAGKTSLTHALIDRLAEQGRRVNFSVSYTTREPRGAEHDGVDYHFVSEEKFLAMIAADAFLEYARVFGYYYGTGRTATDEQLAAGHDVVLDIDWQGAQQVRSAAENVTSIFIMPPSRKELERRLRARAMDDDEAIKRRLAEAREEMAHAQEYDYVVVNDDFAVATDELVKLFMLASGATLP